MLSNGSEGLKKEMVLIFIMIVFEKELVRLEEMDRCKELDDEQADNSVFLQV